jgi:hypothetical protein
MVMHDFSVRDVHNHQHRLYEDYLNNGKVVVFKFFFTTCPPCIANAPSWQSKYVQYGSGNQGVEFFSVTTITGDYDQNVLAFEATYNQTMKGISQDGGAQNIANPFKSGTYGSWYGTPSFAVVAPDHSLQYPVFFNELDAAIALAKTKTGAAPTTVDININNLGQDIPDGHIKLFIKPQNANSPKIEIKKNSQGKYNFTYPSSSIPTLVNPEMVIESTGPALTSKVTASDLIVIQKHILTLESLTDPYKKLAADANGDGKITASDLIAIKRVILTLSSEFPNGTPSYKAIPSTLPLSPSPGNTVTPEFVVFKTGNVN